MMLSHAQVNKTKAAALATDSDKSLGDINEKKFLSTLELANEKI